MLTHFVHICHGPVNGTGPNHVMVLVWGKGQNVTRCSAIPLSILSSIIWSVTCYTKILHSKILLSALCLCVWNLHVSQHMQVWYILCGAFMIWSIFSQILTKDTHSSPVRTRYRYLFGSSLCLIFYLSSYNYLCNMLLYCYNSTWLYIRIKLLEINHAHHPRMLHVSPPKKWKTKLR